MLNTPAKNLTHTTRQGTTPKSFQNTSLSCGMPLPEASRQKEFNKYPTSKDVEAMTAKLPARKTLLLCHLQMGQHSEHDVAYDDYFARSALPDRHRAERTVATSFIDMFGCLSAITRLPLPGEERSIRS
jgi:hypothetical protein